jgi:hypothetical protein
MFDCDTLRLFMVGCMLRAARHLPA